MYFLEIAVVGWNGHHPYLQWTPYQGWDRHPTLSQHLQALGHALEDDRFFRLCYWCGRRSNHGHTTSLEVEEDHPRAPICQGCAERDFGVVY